MIVTRDFFKRTTVGLSKALLGTYLLHDSEEGRTAGRIVETEAYLFRGDPACHAARGETKRNSAMFGPAGHCYIYLIYGMHYCFNVVSGKEKEGEAVLIRALEPVEGIELMKKRRGTDLLRNLCSGPAKLVEAMGIRHAANGSSLRTGPIRILTRDSYPPAHTRAPQTVVTNRIGISSGAELPLRFYVKGSEFISRK